MFDEKVHRGEHTQLEDERKTAMGTTRRLTSKDLTAVFADVEEQPFSLPNF